MVKIYTAKNNQTVVTIPAAIVKAKGLKSGQEAEWVIDNLGNLIFRLKN